MATSCSGVVAAVVLAVLVLAVVNAGARPVMKKGLRSSTCSTSAKYVYPYWSFCEDPAVLYEESFHFLSASGQTASLGGLQPEWDESNNTYYIRFTGDRSDLGARYVIKHPPSSSINQGTSVRVNNDFCIYNEETNYALQWRKEGNDEYFLIEANSEPTTFRFQRAKDVMLPCPLIYPPAECQAYHLISDPAASSGYTDAGLLAYTEGDFTYIKAAPASELGDLPLLVIRARSTITTATI